MQTPRQTVEPFKLCAFPRRSPVDAIKPLNFTSIKRILAAAAFACAIMCAGSVAGLTEAGAIMIEIDKMTRGAEPADFDFARTGQGGPARWAVTSDPSAAVGLALEQTRTDTTDYPFPLPFYPPASPLRLRVTRLFHAVRAYRSYP